MRSTSSSVSLALCLSFLALACTPASPAPSPTSPAPAAAAKPAAPAQAAASPAAPAPSGPLPKLTVAYSNTTPSVTPLWVAKDAGLFEKTGVNVDLTLISGGQVLMASLISGQTPIGLVGGSEVLSAVAG